MDQTTRKNWQLIRDALERAGKTDNPYYRRAVAILSGKPDPLKQDR